MRDLPSSNNIFQLFETAEGEIISDRFYGGGLNTGRSARDGAFLNSWTQTSFFVGDVNVTMPNGGVPFLFPAIGPWERVDVASALMPLDANAPGLAVSLQPARPSATWIRVVDGAGSGGGLVARSSTTAAPPIEALRSASHGGLFVSGPLSPRVGMVADVEWAGASQNDRTGVSQADGRAASVFTNFVFTPNASSELRTLGWIQRTQSPFAAATAVGRPLADQTTFIHVQSTWEHQVTPSKAWRVFGAYSQADASRSGTFPAAFAFERMLVGPVSLLVDSGDHTDRQLSAGARMNASHTRHLFRVGVDAGRTSSRLAPDYTGAIGEADDGKNARVWQYTNNGIDSQRHATTVTAFASDRIGLGTGRSIELGLGYDGVSGTADGAATGISWNSVLPRVSLRWKQSASSHFTWIAGYRRSADRLTLDTLAVGDPSAPTASVLKWTAQGVGPLVMRVGPGTGDNPAFSAIDPSLSRPLTDEIVAGIEAQLTPNIRGRITGVAKEVHNLFDLVDIGAPASSYTTSFVVDGRPEADGGDALLPVYNRIPSTFGADRYLLATRTSQSSATAAAIVLNSEASLKHLTLMFNATASITDGPAENRGFRADENNLGSLGELSIDPNAASFPRGRLFYDRAFTMKLSAVYRFPWGVTFGAIARYQDGQPFSRVTVVQDLNQGTEFVRAYPAGDARFMYTGTLDMRLQKRIVAGSTNLDLFVDGYNVVNMGNEVEERVVTGGPSFRDITAIQPPAAVHVGFRLGF